MTLTSFGCLAEPCQGVALGSLQVPGLARQLLEVPDLLAGYQHLALFTGTWYVTNYSWILLGWPPGSPAARSKEIRSVTVEWNFSA